MYGMGDRTFCSNPLCQNECGRKLTPQQHKLFVKSWGSEDYPLCVSDFCSQMTTKLNRDKLITALEEIDHE